MLLVCVRFSNRRVEMDVESIETNSTKAAKHSN